MDRVEAHGQELMVRVGNGSAMVSTVALALNQRGIVIKELILRTPTLDDVFLQVAGTRLQGVAGEQEQLADEGAMPD